MKHKRRRGVNPLREYRRLQREIRDLYDPFTARHCPGCAAPRRAASSPPASRPWMSRWRWASAMRSRTWAIRTRMRRPWSTRGIGCRPPQSPCRWPGRKRPLDPCDYLHRGRCTFPDDLRPFGCTTYVCGPMYAHLPDETLRPLRRLLRQMEDAHTELLRALRASDRLPQTGEE